MKFIVIKIIYLFVSFKFYLSKYQIILLNYFKLLLIIFLLKLLECIQKKSIKSIGSKINFYELSLTRNDEDSCEEVDDILKHFVKIS